MTPSSFWLHTAKLGLFAFPTAARYFRHYLSGSGHPQEVSLTRLLRDDSGLRNYLFTELSQALQNGESSGTVPAPQPVFSTWSWRLALGSITLHWERLNEDLSLAFTKTYSWNPFVRRISRPIHRAAYAAPAAQAFAILGQPARLSVRDLENACPPRKARFLGRLYL
jgi:hypothetical protein